MNLNEYQNYHETKSHTSIEFPYNTYLCSIPIDFRQVPLHWHNELELIIIKKGCGKISVDFEMRTVNAGDIVIVLPGQLHSIEQKEDSRMEYENILFHPSMLISSEQDLCATRFILPFVNHTLATDTFLTSDINYYNEVSLCIKEIDTLCDKRPVGYQLAVKGYLFHFIYHLVTNQKDFIPNTNTKSLERLKIILKYVEENYEKPISIDDMARLTHYSKSHFMKFFKTHMNTSFIEYLNDYRLTIAARLLNSTDDSIINIASMSGFDNLSYFNRLFKRKFHTTPKKYRTT